MAEASDEIKSLENEFLQSQMSEAWSHYRHCETLRAQYLSFFFSAYLAVTGVVITLLKPDDKTKSIATSTIVGCAAFLFILFWVSACFYILVVRLNAVLQHYAQIMEETRRYFFYEHGQAAKIWSYQRIGLHKARAGIFSVGLALPRLIASLSICVVITEALLTNLLAQVQLQSWQTGLSLGFCVITASALTFLLLKTRAYHKHLI